eukprot:Skav226309  [mRNA]  locus=scaffold3301:531205:533189:- [translate_table: standard]
MRRCCLSPLEISDGKQLKVASVRLVRDAKVFPTQNSSILRRDFKSKALCLNLQEQLSDDKWQGGAELLSREATDIREKCKARRQVPSELHLGASRISRLLEKQMQWTKKKVLWQNREAALAEFQDVRLISDQLSLPFKGQTLGRCETEDIPPGE